MDKKGLNTAATAGVPPEALATIAANPYGRPRPPQLPDGTCHYCGGYAGFFGGHSCPGTEAAAEAVATKTARTNAQLATRRAEAMR